METIHSTNQGQSSTQDNVVKSPCYIPKPDNLAGNESPESTTAGLGTTTGKQGTGVMYKITDVNQRNATQEPYLNISASEENRSAKFKNGEGGPAFNPGWGANQYQ